jgi:hypothetical protein
MQVLMQPRNALGRQFVYQFELSGTRLHITDDAQRAIAGLVRLYAAFLIHSIGRGCKLRSHAAQMAGSKTCWCICRHVKRAQGLVVCVPSWRMCCWRRNTMCVFSAC